MLKSDIQPCSGDTVLNNGSENDLCSAPDRDDAISCLLKFRRLRSELLLKNEIGDFRQYGLKTYLWTEIFARV